MQTHFQKKITKTGRLERRFLRICDCINKFQCRHTRAHELRSRKRNLRKMDPIGKKKFVLTDQFGNPRGNFIKQDKYSRELFYLGCIVRFFLIARFFLMGHYTHTQNALVHQGTNWETVKNKRETRKFFFCFLLN